MFFLHESETKFNEFEEVRHWTSYRRFKGWITDSNTHESLIVNWSVEYSLTVAQIVLEPEIVKHYI